MLSRVRLLSLLLSAVVLFFSAPGQAQVFNCSSNGQHQECDIPGHGNPNDLHVVRQLSRDPCIEGKTWGRHGHRVWVDRGCRADFALGDYDDNRSYNRGPDYDNDRDHDRDRDRRGWDGPPAYYAGNFRGGHSFCSSGPGSGRVYCQSGGAFRFAKPLNVNNMCIENRTWGVTQYGLWVASGCSGEWEIKREGADQAASNYPSGGPGWDRQPAYYAGDFSGGHSKCNSSPGSGRTYCQSGGAFRYANPLRVNSACVQNRTWGVSQYGLWVSNGCAGEWEIKR